MKNLLFTIMLCFALSYASAQTVPAQYLEPKFTSAVGSYTAFGNSTTEYGGFIWNNTGTFYGDGNDFGLYTNGSRDMVLATESGRLFLNTSRVGISTHSPQAKLHIPNGDIIVGGVEGVTNTLNSSLFIKSRADNSATYPLYVGMYGSGSDLFWVRGEGNAFLRGKFGIGTSDPETLLQVTSESNPSIAIGKSGENTGGKSTLAFYSGTSTVQNAFMIQYNRDSGTDRLSFVDGGLTETLTIQNGGNIGIGTTLVSNPNNYRLGVKGRIGAHEIYVENTSSTWADYVFEKDYVLKPLSSVHQYIKENKHLPDVPSKKDIEEHGHKLGEMDVILLKKIEELTLYLIEANESIEKLNEEIEVLKKSVKQ